MSFPAGSIEFLTVAVEFCRFVEGASDMEPSDFSTKLHKLLALLYLKALTVDIPDFDPQEDDEYDVDEFVNEFSYNNVRIAVHNILDTDDEYENMATDAAFSDTETTMCSISEDVADIYQSVGNFAYASKQGDENLMVEALRQCIADFRFYWGSRLLSAITALHKTIAH